MKAVILKDHLAQKVSFINHGVSPRNQLPVLLNIYIEARKGTLTLKSTDLEIGLETNLPANVIEEGSITVPAKIFSELINSIDSERITLELKEKNLSISTDKIKSTLQTIEAEEFPKLYEDKGEKIATLPKESIGKDFGRVLFSASLDTTRPALSGVLIKQEEKGCLLVATDGYRLSLKKIPMQIKKNTEEKDALLVPVRVLREVLGEKEEGDVSLYVSQNNNQVIFEQGETIILGRLIDATFPQYEKIIPANHTTSAVFDKEELLKAVKLSSLFARDGSNVIKFIVGKNKIELFAQTASLGENRVEVEAKISGEGGEIAFNAKYLLDILSHVDEETLVFEMTGPLAPGVFKVQGDDSFLHLIMPIRVQTEE